MEIYGEFFRFICTSLRIARNQKMDLDTGINEALY